MKTNDSSLGQFLLSVCIFLTKLFEADLKAVSLCVVSDQATKKVPKVIFGEFLAATCHDLSKRGY